MGRLFRIPVRLPHQSVIADHNAFPILTTDDQTENGDRFQVVVTNAVSQIDSNIATLNVLAPETILTDWNCQPFHNRHRNIR